MKRILFATVAMSAMLAASVGQAQDLTFMGYSYAEDTARPSVERILEGFEAETGLDVEPIGSAWADVQRNLFLRARSNTLPDVVQISERWLPTFSALGLVDYNEVFGADTLSEIYAPEALAMGQIDGKQLALPLMSGSIGMVANLAVLEQAGVTEIPQSVEEFRAALEAVRDNVPNSVPYAAASINPNSILLDYLIWTWTFGGRVIDDEGNVVVDSPEAREALAFLVELMNERLIAPEVDRPDARRLLAQNTAAFYVDAPQSRSFLRSFSGEGEAFDVNIQPMAVPVLEEGDEPKSIQWGHMIISFAQSEPPVADDPNMQFVRYLAEDAVQTQFPVELSALPGTIAARQNPAISEDPYLTAWAEYNTAPVMNEIGIWDNGAELTQIIGEEVQAALLGQKSADDAITAMAARLQEAMDKLPN
jgi:multiple sugar transport system substrate-binding protein